MICHRCASCLCELPREARRFVVYVPDATEPCGGREDVVCAECVGWYHDGDIEVSYDELAR
jgi:hypothetical protein